MHTIVHTSFSDEYLTFLCSIFLAHDRVFVSSSNVYLDEIGSGAIGLVSNNPPGGKVMERSSASSSSVVPPSLLGELMVMASARFERKGNYWYIAVWVGGIETAAKHPRRLLHVEN